MQKANSMVEAAGQCAGWLRSSALITTLMLAGCAALDPGAPIGIVTRAKGLPEIGRDGARYLVDEQSRVRVGDVLETNATSRLRVILDDGTSLELGGEARLILRRYQPQRGLRAPRTTVAWTMGAVDVRSGATSRGWRSRFEITTPLATMRLREARMLGTISSRPRELQVGMPQGLSISVRNRHGRARLATDGLRIKVPSNAAPEAPASWSTDDARRIEAGIVSPVES